MREIGFILFGWLFGLFSKPLSDTMMSFFCGPRLRLDFDGQQEEFCIRTPVEPELQHQKPREAYFVRIRVRNNRGWRKWSIRSIRKCRGYLVDVRRKDLQTGKFEPVGYCDNIPLKWSYIDAADSQEGLDISDGVDQYLNVVATFSNRPDFVPELTTIPFRYRLLFDPAASLPHGQANGFALCLTIRVCAEELNPQEMKTVVEWYGSWDNFKAYRLN